MPKVTIVNEDIVASEYPMQAMVNVADILEEFELRKQLMSGRPHYLLVKLHGITSFDETTAELLAQPEYIQLTRAVAIVIEQQDGYAEFGKLLLERFLWSEKPEIPIQLFGDTATAMDWFSTL